MLASLHVENLAIIEAAGLRLEPGFNALTGETGAGKSILVGALELALGARASADAVRTGAKMAVIEATFHAPLPRAARETIVSALELEWDGEEPLVLRREISASGRSRMMLNSQLVNVADMKPLGELLVDMHGQHEHQSLFRPAAQRAALDAFGAHEKAAEKYREAYAEWTRLRRRREELAELARDFERRMDYLSFQVAELEQAAPRAGEMAELEGDEARLAHVETLAQAANRAHALLYEGIGEEGMSILGAMREARRELEQIARLDPSMEGLPGKAAEIEALAEDLAMEARAYAGKCEADPERLNEVIARIEALKRLMQKHGAAAEEDLIRSMEELRAERDKMALDERERAEIDGALAAAEKKLESLAAELCEARGAAGKKMAAAATKTLAEVAMEKASFRVDVARVAEFGPEGADRVEFMLAANPGEPAKPLRETASGGELSRTMLAIKTALAKRDAIPTLVFDEIDAGISGETAARVGRLMEKLAASHQILCITHHASIAARAGHHLSVRKTTQKGRTQTAAIELAGEERLEELARMMGGDGASAEGKRLAKKLMGAA